MKKRLEEYTAEELRRMRADVFLDVIREAAEREGGDKIPPIDPRSYMRYMRLSGVFSEGGKVTPFRRKED